MENDDARDAPRTSDVHYSVHWIDRRRAPKCAPNPEFPQGMDADISYGAARTCRVPLPYPAPRCGLWRVVCEDCGLSVGVTAAGRPDDAKSVTLPCKPVGATGEFPDGKISEDDEGELSLAVSHNDKGLVVFDFGSPVKWLAMVPDKAEKLANAIIDHARQVKQ